MTDDRPSPEELAEAMKDFETVHAEALKARTHCLEVLRQADVVVFDALANPVLLGEAPANAERIDVGKRARAHKLTQDETNDLLVPYHGALV